MKQTMFTDNELPCQKTENYSTAAAVLHREALMEALEIKLRYRCKHRRRMRSNKFILEIPGQTKIQRADKSEI